MADPSLGRLSVDVEKVGPLPIHPIKSIGAVLGDRNGRITHRFKVKFAVDRKKYDEGTYNWMKSKNMDVEPNDGVSQHVGWNLFNNFLKTCERTYPGDKLEIVSDCPSFDLKELDNGLWKYCKRYPVKFTVKKDGHVYRCVVDPDERLTQIGKQKEAKNEVNKIIEHDHDPAHDAEHIYYLQLMADRYAAKLKEVLEKQPDLLDVQGL